MKCVVFGAKARAATDKREKKRYRSLPDYAMLKPRPDTPFLLANASTATTALVKDAESGFMTFSVCDVPSVHSTADVKPFDRSLIQYDDPEWISILFTDHDFHLFIL